MKPNIERLLACARATREAKSESFSMAHWLWTCGAPACAIGNYAARRDLQQTFAIQRVFVFEEPVMSKPLFEFEIVDTTSPLDPRRPMHDMLVEHFGLPRREILRLFGEESYPVGVTPVQVADAIEAWAYERASSAEEFAVAKARVDAIGRVE